MKLKLSFRNWSTWARNGFLRDVGGIPFLPARGTPGIASVSEQEYSVLVTQIAAGDLDAESRLVQHFSRGLMAMLRKKTNDWDLAADIHQETFVVVINRLRKRELQDPKGLKSYLRRTAINLLLGDCRKQLRRKTSLDNELIARIATKSLGPLQSLERDQRARLVRELIEGLISELTVDRDRQLLRRHYLARESKQQICADLDMDRNNFDRVLFRARERLKEKAREYVASARFEASGGLM